MRRFNISQAQNAKGQQKHWLYNCMDNIAQRQIADHLLNAADEVTMRNYAMERSVQNAAFAMSTRGFLVDEVKRDQKVAGLVKEIAAAKRKLAKNETIIELWDQKAIASDPKIFGKKAGICPNSKRKDHRHTWPRGVDDEDPDKKCEMCGLPRMKVAPFSATSPDQVSHLFYDLMKCKKQYDKKHKVSVDEDCLERIGKSKKAAKPIADAIANIRDLTKQKGLLGARLQNGCYMTSFNVGVALTDRWSSNKNAFGNGGNCQNIPERHRDVFIARPGKVLVYADLKQAESKTIAYKSGDPQYIKAHDNDTHTYVCQLVWPEGFNGEPWPAELSDTSADALKAKAKFAKSHFPEWDNVAGHDFRFQSKAVQHGSNLGLTAFGLAMQKHIPVEAARDAQSRYFRAFPGIRGYQNFIREKVTNQEPIVNPLGVRFLLYGRPWDEHTVKQGLALIPQSMVANVINLAAERIFEELDPWKVQLLAQVHDALVMEIDEGDMKTMRRVYELMLIPVPVTDINGVTRMMTIEPELAAGHNWKHFNDNPERGDINLEGLKEVHL